MSDNRGGPSARDRGRNDVFRLVEGAAPAGPTPDRPRLPDDQARLVEATVGRCLGLIAHAVGREPHGPLLSIIIGHTVYATVLGVVAEEVSPALREQLAHNAAEAIARAVREAAP
jgi:hypothetical protein